MGGKKKTKWRKLPLEEFTKEYSANTEKVSSEERCQPELSREEESYTPSYNETTENPHSYAEPYEFIDGLWYPTSCVVYNPAEVGIYPNYMMPVDTNYYYYTMPDMSQMQDYMPIAYPEYSALPKDTVYLLLPTQTLRPSQALPNIVPEWHSRRRRRYEAYTDHAVVPEQSNLKFGEERDHSKRTGYVNSRRSSSQSNHFKRMTSYSDTNNFDNDRPAFERNQGYSKSNETKKSSMSLANSSAEKDSNLKNKETDNMITDDTRKRKKSLEVCGIHTKSTTGKNELQTVTEKESCNIRLSETQNELQTATNTHNNENESQTNSDSAINTSNLLASSSGEQKISDIQQTLDKESSKIKQQSNITEIKNSSTKNEIGDTMTSRNDLKVNTGAEISLISNEVSQNIPVKSSVIQDETKVDIPNIHSQSSLPDILSTLNKKPTNSKSRDIRDMSKSPLPQSVDTEKEKPQVSKSLLCQTSYLPNLLSSEALHNEMEIELKQLKNLHSLQANQSIYKLAYDENVTDQSEADSRSPSPLDPESQVPSSLPSAEILIHEADSGSEAGSEDVELLPHRYESETFLHENKHVYVNKLSLAVELLRTQENLPYDDEFKRVVGENSHANNIVPVHTGGKINHGFVEDSFSSNRHSITNTFENKYPVSANEVVTQCQLKHSANTSRDSAIYSDIDFENLEDELCEPAAEAEAQDSEIQDNTEGVRAGYRRFGVQARHYFSPRAALSLNPCFCCIIM